MKPASCISLICSEISSFDVASIVTRYHFTAFFNGGGSGGSFLISIKISRTRSGSSFIGDRLPFLLLFLAVPIADESRKNSGSCFVAQNPKPPQKANPHENQ
jgi:hypothetical protein